MGGRTVDCQAAAIGREELLTDDGRAGQAENRVAVVAERNVDGEVGVALRVVVSAVDGIDDPEPALVPTFDYGRGLFGEDGVIRILV
jgi:hypothetical protein